MVDGDLIINKIDPIHSFGIWILAFELWMPECNESSLKNDIRTYFKINLNGPLNAVKYHEVNPWKVKGYFQPLECSETMSILLTFRDHGLTSSL